MEEEVKLKKLVKELSKKRGRNTELVSVLIPAGANINDVADQITQEKSTAVNIKSKQTRKNVVAALEKIERFLSQVKQTPKNGLAIYCGNVSEKEGESDIRLWWIEPPEPLRTKLYWCGQEFKLEPLREMIKSRDVYGIICLDKNEADIAILNGKRIEPLAHFDSIVPGKTRAGGQSSARFARIREGLKNDFLKQVGEAASKIFERYPNLIGIIVSGTGMIKYEFAKGDFLHKRFKDKIIGVVDTAYTGEFGLHETLERGEDLLRETEALKEKKLLQRFFDGLRKDPPMSVYGFGPTMKAMEMGALDTLIVSEDLEIVHVRYSDGSEDVVPDGMVDRSKKIEGMDDGFDKLEEMAGRYSTKLEVVSSDTREGNQFFLMGGIGGILRYAVG